MTTTKVYGGPGTGKTWTLIERIKTAVEQGRRVTYVTFSRAMAKEARERADLPKRVGDFAVAGTVHSIMSQLLELDKGSFLPREDVAEFFESKGIEFHVSEYPDLEQALTAPGQSLGARLLSEFDAHRHSYRKINPPEGYLGDIDGLYLDYQNTKGARLDYTDILLEAKERGVSPYTHLFIVDEYQDFTPLMRDVTKAAEKDAEEVIIAGDDDQSIYGFMGTAPSLMLEHTGEEEVLSKSHRCKQGILSSAHASLMGIPAEERKEKHLWGEAGGHVHTGLSLDAALQNALTKDGTLYILTRTNRMAMTVATSLIKKGIVFGAINPKHWNMLTPWNRRMTAVNNALATMTEGNEPYVEESKRLIEALPADLMIHGAKTKFLGKVKQFENSATVDVPSIYSLFWHRPKPQKLLWSLNPRLVTKRMINAVIYRGLKRLEDFKVFVDTKHAAKGKEADRVISIQKIPKFVKRRMEIDASSRYEEARLEYVARSRARDELFIV